MTEKTCEVARLDRKTWPPECKAEAHADRFCWTVGHVSGASFVAERSREATEREALDAAWDQQEAQHDPPGMLVVCRGAVWTWGLLVAQHTDAIDPKGDALDLPTARRVAWAYFWRRKLLADRMDAVQDKQYRADASESWPDVLTWLDDLVETAERDLAEVEAALNEVIDPEPWPA